MSSPDGAAPANRCCARDCGLPLDSASLMCPSHWSLLPASLREAITAAGQAVGTAAEGTYRRLVTAAITEVAHKQARQQPRRFGGVRKPVQLALFEVRSTR